MTEILSDRAVAFVADHGPDFLTTVAYDSID